MSKKKNPLLRRSHIGPMTEALQYVGRQLGWTGRMWVQDPLDELCVPYPIDIGMEGGVIKFFPATDARGHMFSDVNIYSVMKLLSIDAHGADRSSDLARENLAANQISPPGALRVRHPSGREMLVAFSGEDGHQADYSLSELGGRLAIALVMGHDQPDLDAFVAQHSHVAPKGIVVHNLVSFKQRHLAQLEASD